MTKLDNLIDRMKLAGRQTAESWLGSAARDAEAHESQVRAMTRCLSSIILAPMIAAPVLLMAFSWPHAVAGALAAAAMPIAVAGMLAATGSERIAGNSALLAVSAALAALAVSSGGLTSPFLPLLALLPLEAAMQSRRLSGLAHGLLAALTAVLAIAAVDAGGHSATIPDGALAAAAIAFALYALVRGLAFGMERSRPAAVIVVAETDRPVEIRTSDILDRLSGLVTLHNAHGDVLRVSGADKADFTRLIGDFSGKGFVNRIHVADRIAFLDAVDSLRRGEARSQVELRFDCPGEASQFVHVAVELSAERDEDGSFAGVMAQTRDISAEVADYFRTNAVVEEAESANASKTRFLAAVSHELRTPLNAIIGFSDILAREMFGKFSDERQREYVGLIHQSGHHLLSLVNTMLDMSKIEAGRYEVFVEAFPIGDVIDSCDAMLRLQASNRGVTLTRRLARGESEVVADRGAVQQILINLVGNAIKFTETGGVVNVDAAIRDGRLQLVVSDTGIGIPADKLARIGEPFVQAQNELGRHYEGTGLGLSLVKGLVDLHGGEFTIESSEGEGTVVTIELPADGSGANPEPDDGETGAAVVFPPLLPKAARKSAGNLARLDTKTRNEAYAETARIA
ncbi:PAS domain-containing sensor histidine kinase [Hoeflea sp. AS60]|uniref:sensor histidine kinase n=1 Tax=Hoeflea sp. AS60 TaxID=3135780 RepID=UPI00317609FE